MAEIVHAHQQRRNSETSNQTDWVTLQVHSFTIQRFHFRSFAKISSLSEVVRIAIAIGVHSPVASLVEEFFFACIIYSCVFFWGIVRSFSNILQCLRLLVTILLDVQDWRCIRHETSVLVQINCYMIRLCGSLLWLNYFCCWKSFQFSEVVKIVERFEKIWWFSILIKVVCYFSNWMRLLKNIGISRVFSWPVIGTW